MSVPTISDLGEKRLIAEFVAPLFNPSGEVGGVGDDCAMIEGADGYVWLFSTDRVPADLISFRLGIIDHYGLGRYLAWLNISDIIACGGKPLALLLNLGLPTDFLYDDFRMLCRGFGDAATKYSCRVLGGDISSSREISISATSIGKVLRGHVLTRRGAHPGDTVFISRPLGLTPAAFGYYLRCSRGESGLSEDVTARLDRQFTAIEPLALLGAVLSESGRCTSCMDNTDGVGQSLLELSMASGTAFVIDSTRLALEPLVLQIASCLGEDPVQFAFGAGADFSLVGTLDGEWSQSDAESHFGRNVRVIGHVEDGAGVSLETTTGRTGLQFSGWNYFSPPAQVVTALQHAVANVAEGPG
jgi:thiamine-monophosphate kinase